MLFRKNELKLLWPFYLDAVVSPLLYFFPVFAVLYYSQIGITFFQIGILTAVAGVAAFIFEIPTGAIADLYGRKFSVLTSWFLQGIGFISLFFVREFYGMMLIFTLIAIASTLSSGAKEAWVIDLIGHQNKSLQKRFFIKSQTIDSIGLILSGFVGAFMVKASGLSIIMLTTGASFFLSFVICFFAKERKVKYTPDVSVRRITKKAVDSIRYSKNHRVLFSFFIATAFMILALNLQGSLVWTPLLQSLNMPDYTFGYLWSASAIMGVIAPLLASRLLKVEKEKSFIIASVTLAAVVAFLILFAHQLAAVITILLLSTILLDIRRPAERIYFHRFIPSKLRASIGSLESMTIALTGAIVVPFAGLLVDNIGPKYTFFISGVMLLIVAIIYYKIKEPENN